MIQDKLGHTHKACQVYKKCMRKCEEDPKLTQSQQYLKASTNYAVAMEKLGQREKALSLLETMKSNFTSEARILNNLGIIQKRAGLPDQALQNLHEALAITDKDDDISSFFPLYNMGVLKASLGTAESDQEAINSFERAI